MAVVLAPDIPDGTVAGAPSEKVPESSTEVLDQKSPTKEPAPEPPQPVKASPQETSQVSTSARTRRDL